MNHLIHYKNRIVKNKQKLEAAKTQVIYCKLKKETKII